MFRNFFKWPSKGIPLGNIVVAIILCAAIVLIAWYGIRSLRAVEAFVDKDPNIVAFNEFRSSWGSRAVASGLINSSFFPTYAAILNVPEPAAGVSEADFTKAVDQMAQAIKVWYVNAKYRGNLVQLAVEIDKSKPPYVPPFTASGSGDPLPNAVPPKDAAEGLNRNLNYELGTFTGPTYDAYKELLDMGAQAYLTLPEPAPSADEVRRLREAKYPVVEKQILEESGGNTIPFVAMMEQISRMKASGLSPSLTTVGVFNLLPKTISLYTSTLSYLNKKAEMLATNANNLQAPPGSDEPLLPVRGTLKDDSASAEEFIDMPDSQTFRETLAGQATLGADGEVAKLKTANADEAIASAYRVSETRRRFLAEEKPTFDTTLKNTKELYGRLKALRDAAGSSGSPIFAAIANGADLNEALSTSASAIEAFFGGRNGFL
jgi:hypothetical protein